MVNQNDKKENQSPKKRTSKKTQVGCAFDICPSYLSPNCWPVMGGKGRKYCLIAYTLIIYVLDFWIPNAQCFCYFTSSYLSSLCLISQSFSYMFPVHDFGSSHFFLFPAHQPASSFWSSSCTTLMLSSFLFFPCFLSFYHFLFYIGYSSFHLCSLFASLVVGSEEE